MLLRKDPQCETERNTLVSARWNLEEGIAAVSWLPGLGDLQPFSPGLGPHGHFQNLLSLLMTLKFHDALASSFLLLGLTGRRNL